MVIRTETHLNVPLKSKLRNLTWEQAVKYGLLHDLNHKGTHIVSTKQDGDKLIIVKRIPTEKNFVYRFGFRQRGWYAIITFLYTHTTLKLNANYISKIDKFKIYLISSHLNDYF